jgi:elongation factor Ts
MANYGPAEIKEIREKTGAGMLDVKKALDESDGNKNEAIKIIRLKGLKGIAKRESRDASAGLITAKLSNDKKTGYILELNSETDFVGKSEIFINNAENFIDFAVKDDILSVDDLLKIGDIKDQIMNLSATVGEKIVLKRFQRVQGDLVSVYLHKSNPDLPPQVGVLLGLQNGGQSKMSDVGHKVAMHIAAAMPKYLSIDDVPKEIIDDEIKLAKDIAVKDGKPESIAENIAKGKVNAFYKENVLLNQIYAIDQKTPIEKLLDGVELTDFVRFIVGA